MKADRFAHALEPHLDDALNYCRALCVRQTNQDAEDILQVALLKAYRGFDGLKKSQSFKAWLFRIITNSYYTQTRNHFWKRFVPIEQNDQSFPGVYTEDNELNLSMKYALMQLSKKERVAILLYEIGGFSIREITEFQGDNSQSAVKSRLSRARQRLKHFLQLDQDNRQKSFLTSHHLPGDLQYETIQMAEEINIKK